MLSLETIMRDTLWVAKMTYGRRVGTYEELEWCLEEDELRDFDICAKQPEHLEVFYDLYFEHCKRKGWTTVQEFYAYLEGLREEYEPKLKAYAEKNNLQFA